MNFVALRPRIPIQQGHDECVEWKARLRPRLDVPWMCFNGSHRKVDLNDVGP